VNFLYLSDFKGGYDPDSPRLKPLARLGAVHGLDPDYEDGYAISKANIFEQFTAIDQQHEIDAIAGTHLGGWMAAHVGASLGIPFIAFNPEYDARRSLSRYTTDKPTIESYPAEFNRNGCGLLLFEEGDPCLTDAYDVSDMHQYSELFSGMYEMAVLPEGSYGFNAIEKVSGKIQSCIDACSLVYGLEPD